MNEDEKDKIYHMRAELGMTHKAIADSLGLSKGGVYWFCMKEGIERYGLNCTRKHSNIKGIHNRKGVLVRGFTDEEDDKLLKLEAKGLGSYQIGKILGRNHSSIHGRLATLARRDERQQVY